MLVDQIYWNRTNRAFCKKYDIRISGSILKRTRKISQEERKQVYTENTDRIEVEWGFSLA
ncbi:MAG: transposase [Lachnospiraceae bacterium]|nr:transposase [Lachnospiraceae bacterium]